MKFEPKIHQNIGFYKLQMECVKTKKATQIGGLQAVIKMFVLELSRGLLSHAEMSEDVIESFLA